LAAGPLLFEFFGRLERGGVFIGTFHRQPRAFGQRGGETVGSGTQAAGTAVGIGRAADYEQMGFESLDGAIDGLPVDSARRHRDDAVWGGATADTIAGGDADAPQAEIERQDDLGYDLEPRP